MVYGFGKAQPFRTEGGKPRFVRPNKFFAAASPTWRIQLHGADYS
jgi:hypothetical protein